jgi:hypothetical protein
MKVDPLALAELRAASIEASIKAGRPLTRKQEGFWSKDVAEALQRRHAIRGYVVRSRLLRRAQTDDRLSVTALALKVLETIDDRLLGKPVPTEPQRGGVTVIFGPGLDPSRLPAAPAKPAVDVPSNTIDGSNIPDLPMENRYDRR